ncbi:sensor histidine kinase [Paenibacillus sp. IB182496]|uniref:histidine kinase n=1 Tax=Paenibacillus sabuli TaxID=2772509 RepID=A0A927GRJ3_9BACL|nr:sensor histidine kinase [Paenibacillus sabuli]MBD2845040.1 sensor histidine kinase [Paenibacillus sabuli]
MTNKLNPLRSIRGKLVLSLLVLVIVPTLLIFWNYAHTSRKVVAEEVNSANQELADRAAEAIDDVATRMIRALFLLETDFEDYYVTGPADWTANYADYAKVHLLQRRMASIRDLLLDSSAFLIYTDRHGLAVSTFYSFDMLANYAILVEQDWYREGERGGGFPQWQFPYRLVPGMGSTEVGRSEGYLALSRSLRDETELGVALIGIPIQAVFAHRTPPQDGELPSQLLWDGEHALLDAQGRTALALSASEAAELRRPGGAIKRLTRDGQTYMANVSPVEEIGASVVSLVPEEQFLEQLTAKQSQSLLWIVVVFLVSALVFALFLLRFTRPIYAMLRSMRKVGAGDFKTAVAVSGQDEMALLGRNFNQMVSRLDELLRRLEEERQLKEEAHFQSLQAQINPHFLFNTLNSIKLMAMLSNTNRNVSDMITALGKLLEFSMKMHQRFVTLGQEIEYLELYMALQKIRYPDQIALDIEVDPALRRLYMLKFTLQPLVENSIVHGGRMPLAITVRAAASEGVLRIAIRDDGVGVPEERLPEIRERLVLEQTKYSGIGLSNVDRRIKLYFGPAYGITLSNIAAGGLEVAAVFPLWEEPRE